MPEIVVVMHHSAHKDVLIYGFVVMVLCANLFGRLAHILSHIYACIDIHILVTVISSLRLYVYNSDENQNLFAIPR